MSTRKTIPLFLLLLVASLLLSACQGSGGQAIPEVEADISDEVESQVSSTGIVLPPQYSTLSVSTTGIVEEVVVKEGDQVEAGQVLIRLKGQEELKAALATARLELLSAEQALEDIDEDAATVRAEALKMIADANEIVRDAKYQLDNFTVPTNQEDMEPLEAVDTMRARLDKARQAFEPYKNKASGDSTRRRLKEDLDEAQADYNAAVRRLNYMMELEQAMAKLERAKQDYAKVADGPDADQVALAEARLDNAKAALAAAEAALNDLEFKALFAGTVSKVYARAGEWVAPGQPILQIADLSSLRVETTDLSEIDVARIQENASARVTFDALPDVAVNGRVTQIALKSSEGSGVNYTVVIELDEIPANLRWGMTAFVDIQLE